MAGQRNGPLPIRLPDPHSRAYTAETLVLVELVVGPAANGDSIGSCRAF